MNKIIFNYMFLSLFLFSKIKYATLIGK